MQAMVAHLLKRWTVDYGDGTEPRPITVPHAWLQEVPLAFEGPVIYRCVLDVPKGHWAIRFHGVSYEAIVYVAGDKAATHRGIWDSFDVELEPSRGGQVPVEVHVTKNGGPSFPVKDVLSGFLPFVFHTFGGIYKDVELVEASQQPESVRLPQNVAVDGRRMLLNGKPFYPRGLLHWGWYPELGHANPTEAIIRHEVRTAKALGFNLVKFCLWVPPHVYLDVLEEEGMAAWMELPLWDPTGDEGKRLDMAGEIERIARQYRRHRSIAIWTAGCELSDSTPADYRRYLTEMLESLTGCALVKDNSGGAEMYGGDLREFGTFYDFHPYCETQFYPQVLESLMPGPRPEMPVLLGEFNDIDVHRDLAKLAHKIPYWASTLPELNAQGVRWQQDLPGVLASSRFAHQPARNGHGPLMESSRIRALWMRKTVQEYVRAHSDIAGYVITGLRDTPISSAGFADDFNQPRFSPSECAPWNGPDCLFLIPNRRPPWVNGGNRPGWADPQNFFTGRIYWRIGVHSESGAEGRLLWRILDDGGRVVARGADERMCCPALSSRQVGSISWDCQNPGSYALHVELAGVTNEWPVWVVAPWMPADGEGWAVRDPLGYLARLGLPASGGSRILATEPIADDAGISFLTGAGTTPMPFWREAAYEFRVPSFWDEVPFADRWERLLPVSPDCALAEAADDGVVLMNRIDVRTYREAPVIVRAGDRIATTLRPFGGLGTQPMFIDRNPAGIELIRSLMRTFD